MTDILEKIKSYKLEEIAQAKSETPLLDIENAAKTAPSVRPFAETLRKSSCSGGYGLIAEVKKASPSKGLIREDFDPALLAKAYEEGGAACLSVLTDGPSFQGDNQYLSDAREATDLPVLRKDFMLDTYQIVESRALGADCILLIMAMLEDEQAQELEDAAIEQNMDVLIEIHTHAELDRATQLKSKLIGINNRNLTSFKTNIGTTKKLAPELPGGYIIVSESGLKMRNDLAQLARFGVRNFLIGESLMREEDVERATRKILSSPWSPEAA